MNLKNIRKAIMGHKVEMRARVYRKTTGKWEDHGVIASSYRGGIVAPLRALFHIITGTKTHIAVKGR